MQWDQETTIRLISEYRKREILWNPRNATYYNKIKKEDAWSELAAEIGSNIEEVKKKMDSLKGSYRREKGRVKKTVATGKGREEIYESKWFAFRHMQFLDDKDEPRNTFSNVQSEHDDDTEGDTADHDLDETNSEMIQEVNEETVTTQAAENREPSNLKPQKEFKSPQKRCLKRARTEEDPRIEKAFQYLQEVNNKSKVQVQKDQCSLFGDYIADKIRAFDHRLRAIAQNKISNIIFQLEMSAYEPQNSDVTTHTFPKNPVQCMPSQNTEFLYSLQQFHKSQPHLRQHHLATVSSPTPPYESSASTPTINLPSPSSQNSLRSPSHQFHNIPSHLRQHHVATASPTPSQYSYESEASTPLCNLSSPSSSQNSSPNPYNVE